MMQSSPHQAYDLLQGGAFVNALDLSGSTPLHWAARKGAHLTHPPVAQLQNPLNPFALHVVKSSKASRSTHAHAHTRHVTPPYIVAMPVLL